MIVSCESCGAKPHSQDKMYGWGMRVHNQMKDITKVRCTVCNTIRNSKIKVEPVVEKEQSE